MHSFLSRALAAGAAVSTLAAAAVLATAAPAFAATPDASKTFSATGAIQMWTVPVGVTQIFVDVAGGQGGSSYGDPGDGGDGAELTGTLDVTPGQTLNILAGGAGGDGTDADGATGGGGGGGSFIYTSADQSGLLAAAGGGGGGGTENYAHPANTGTSGTSGDGNEGGAGGTNGDGGQGGLGAGGGGLLTDGGYFASYSNEAGHSLIDGGAGGAGWDIPSGGSGGFGGGGGGIPTAGGGTGGGGGGYSGGGGGFGVPGAYNGGGGGGGSYFAVTPETAVNTHTGAGFVTIYYPSAVAAIVPAVGRIGDSLTIGGIGLTGSTVTIGGVAATVTSSSDTQIVATVPAQSPLPAGAQTVEVSTPGGGDHVISQAFTYVPAPTVTQVSPATSERGSASTVTITGTDFTAATAVTFGTTSATSFAVISDTTIMAVVPSGVPAGTVDTTVVTADGASAASAADQVTLVDATVTLSPATLPNPQQGIAYSHQLTANGGSAPYTYSITSGALPGGLTLNAASGTLSGTPTGDGDFSFTVTATDRDGDPGVGAYSLDVLPPMPLISEVSPLSGPTSGGTDVTITGTNLGGATAVLIGGAPVTSFMVVSPTTIAVVTAAGPVGMRTVTVTTPGGTTGISATIHFSYVGQPTVTDVSPPTGTVYGGTPVTLTGTGFTGASAVDFGGTTASSFTVNSDSSITAVAPASVLGPVDVTVTTVGGVSATSIADLFTFVAPTITLSPATVPDGKQGIAYSQSLSASGDQGSPYTYALTSGALPDGVTIGSDGTISGTPTVSGSFGFTVTASGPDSFSGSAAYTLDIASSVPTITGIAPATGQVGASVTITGTDLDGASATIDGQPAASDPSATNSATSLTVLVPASSAAVGAPVDVVVTNSWGSVTATGAFSYLAPPSLTLTAQFAIGDEVDGATATIQVAGFAAGQPVTAVVHSTPTTIYSGVVGVTGVLNATVVLPKLTEGSHELIVTAGAQEKDIWFAVSSTGIVSAVSTSGPVTDPITANPASEASAPTPSGLAHTGSNVDSSLTLAASLLLAGLIAGGIALIARRRREAR